MDSLQSFAAVPSLLLIIILSELQFTSSNKSTSFSLKLIHRYSPESPLYPGPLTFQERLESYANISESCVSYWRSFNRHNRTMQPNLMRPRVGAIGYLYLVELEIGSPQNFYYLIMDAGSSLSWCQCQPCKECFHQKYDIYDPKLSETFQNVPCFHPLCQNYQCINQQCSYSIKYMDGDSTEGYIASETLHIPDKDGHYTHIGNYLFGCSNLNRGNYTLDGHDLVTGVLGLDLNPTSFISQLGSYIMRRFSYCLVDPTSPEIPHVSYPKFGFDMGYTGGPVQKTPFVKRPKPYQYSYSVKLLDISVDNKPLNYPPGTFDIDQFGTGGFIVDVGAILSYFADGPYYKLEDAFVRYFSPYKQLQRRQCNPPYKLCYYAPQGFPLFPSMTYHFEGANLTINKENVFFVSPSQKMFFLAIASNPMLSILGSFQQHSTRFIYDLDNNYFAFVPDDCPHDN